jgi:hypothetical protein
MNTQCLSICVSLLLPLAGFLGVLSTLAIETLLKLKLKFPVVRKLHESILQPDKILPEAPVRG